MPMSELTCLKLFLWKKIKASLLNFNILWKKIDWSGWMSNACHSTLLNDREYFKEINLKI